MTAAKQQLETEALIGAISTHLQSTGWGTFIFNSGRDVATQIEANTMGLQFLPNGPKPLQMGDTNQKYYERVLQIDSYMATEGRALALNDTLMDFFDLTSVVIIDPLAGNAIVGNIACYDTDSIYSEIAPPNLLNPKVIRWRAIVRATLQSFYPNN